MKMYKAATGFNMYVEEHEIERTTEKFVVFPNGGKEAKSSTHLYSSHEWFGTRIEAVLHLKDRAQISLTYALEKLRKAEDRLVNINGWLDEEG